MTFRLVTCFKGVFVLLSFWWVCISLLGLFRPSKHSAVHHVDRKAMYKNTVDSVDMYLNDPPAIIRRAYDRTQNDAVVGKGIVQEAAVVGEGIVGKAAVDFSVNLNQGYLSKQPIQHVVFSTYMCGKCTALRTRIERNSQHLWTNLTPPTFAFIHIDIDNVEKNEYNMPLLKSMYMIAEAKYPHAVTYTYVNGDIIVKPDFFTTIEAVASRCQSFIMVGRRLNVNWKKEYDLDGSYPHHMAETNAQDFFVVHRDTVNWQDILPVVIGRAGYDNWLVDFAYHHPNILLVDGTNTMTAIHQSDERGNKGWSVTRGITRADRYFNYKLCKGKWDHGHTTNAAIKTEWDPKAASTIRITGQSNQFCSSAPVRTSNNDRSVVSFSLYSNESTVATRCRQTFKIIVLTKNRPKSLKRLLESISSARYGDDVIEVEIRIDGDDQPTQSVANSWAWHHKQVIQTKAGSLRMAWLQAWRPDPTDRCTKHAIIFEDDVQVSPAWYEWLKPAWKAYANRSDIAGITLQRHQLIPMKHAKQETIENDNKPFLFRLLGTYGFSPHPRRWAEFLNWLDLIMKDNDIDTYDFSVPANIITNDWFKSLSKQGWWEYTFIKFCDDRNLFTLYTTLPRQEALAAHWREKGEHYSGGQGKDFTVAQKIERVDFLEPVKYGWDGKKEKHSSPIMSLADRIHAQHGVVGFQLLNEGYVEMTKSWICNVRRFGTVLPMTLFVATDEASYRALTLFDATLHVVLAPYAAPKQMQYGQTVYYQFMLFRTNIITNFLAANITIWLFESDAVWLRDPTKLVMSTKGDVVTMSDARPPQKLLQGGFQLLRATRTTVKLWEGMRSAFKSKMKSITRKEIGDEGSEQLMLDRMIRKDSTLHVGWLSAADFVSGLWYQDSKFRAKHPAPMVILNNWIIGNVAKTNRAKKWHHWFLTPEGKCDGKNFEFDSDEGIKTQSSCNLSLTGQDERLDTHVLMRMQTWYKGCRIHYYNDATRRNALVAWNESTALDAINIVSHPVMVADIFRLAALYHNGGYYMDLKSGFQESKDVSCLQSNFGTQRPWFVKDANPTSPGLVNWLIYSPKGNSGIKFILDNIVATVLSRKEPPETKFEERVWSLTGPRALKKYTHLFDIVPADQFCCIYDVRGNGKSWQDTNSYHRLPNTQSVFNSDSMLHSSVVKFSTRDGSAEQQQTWPRTSLVAAPTTWVIILTVNLGYVDILNNFLNWYEPLRLNVRTVIIAEDQPSWKQIHAIRLPPHTEIRASSTIEAMPSMGVWNISDYNRLVSKRPAHLLPFLQAGYHVLYSDIDSVWKSSPLPFWDDAVDMMYVLDVLNKDKTTNYCTGLLFVAPTTKAIEFFLQWKHQQRTGAHRNQEIFNNLLANTNLNAKVLPLEKFPSGYYYFDKGRRQHAVVIHNNYIQGHDSKVARFKQHGLWRNQDRHIGRKEYVPEKNCNLPSRWDDPSHFTILSKSTTCEAAKCLTISETYGRSNNIMLRFLGELYLSILGEYALTSQSDQEALTLIRTHFPTAIDNIEPWLCWKTASRCTEYVEYSAQQMYDSSTFNISRHMYQTQSILLRGVLLHANEQIRRAVDTFDTLHNLSCNGFVAIHVRFLEGECRRRISTGEVFYGVMRNRMWSLDGRQFWSAQDICEYSDRFINFFNPKKLPIFLLHDGQQKRIANRITTKHRALTLPGSSMWAEMILALRATTFVGNPASSLSYNIIRARAA